MHAHECACVCVCAIPHILCAYYLFHLVLEGNNRKTGSERQEPVFGGMSRAWPAVSMEMRGLRS